jgi:hypothetical protein
VFRQTKLILDDWTHLIASGNVFVAQDSMNSGNTLRSPQVEGLDASVGVRAVDNTPHKQSIIDENIVDIHRLAGDMLPCRFVRERLHNGEIGKFSMNHGHVKRKT